MNQEIIKTISEELNVRVHQIEAVLSLLEEGNTVPFIARYRKEKTGALDEDQIRTIDKMRFHEKLGTLDGYFMKKVNEAIKTSLDLK